MSGTLCQTLYLVDLISFLRQPLKVVITIIAISKEKVSVGKGLVQLQVRSGRIRVHTPVV